MAKRDKIYLKTYFETGDKPTEEQFGEFIDSTVNTEQTSSQYISSSLVVQGNITANTFIVTQSVIVSQTGSTAFGNSIDDKHHFTGSLLASGSVFLTWEEKVPSRLKGRPFFPTSGPTSPKLLSNLGIIKIITFRSPWTIICCWIFSCVSF